MELIEAIRSRRSVRDFTDRLVDRETLLGLLRAAALAPSAINLQPWVFAVVQNQALLKRYSDRAKGLVATSDEFKAMSTKLQAMLSDPGFNIFYNARTLVVVCARPTGAHPDWDCCFAAQNLMLAAHAQGLGTCPIGLAWPLLKQADVLRDLSIPEDYIPVLPIIVGYPRTSPPATERHEPVVLCWK